MPLLEALCNSEDTSVRTAAAISTSKVLSLIEPSLHATSVLVYFELYKRLACEDTGEVFYGRMSACQMASELYRVLPDEASRMVFMEIFARLCADDLSMVRKAGVNAFLRTSSFASAALQSGEFLQLFKTLLNDESQSVKVAAIEYMAPYTLALKKIDAMAVMTTELLKVIKLATDDPSWRVRLAISKTFGTYASVFDPTDVLTELFPAAIHMIQDPEPDVRSQALSELLSFLTVIRPDAFFAGFIPIAVQLIEDPISGIRKILAEICIDASAIVGPDLTTQHLVGLSIYLNIKLCVCVFLFFFLPY